MHLPIQAHPGMHAAVTASQVAKQGTDTASENGKAPTYHTLESLLVVHAPAPEAGPSWWSGFTLTKGRHTRAHSLSHTRSRSLSLLTCCSKQASP